MIDTFELLKFGVPLMVSTCALGMTVYTVWATRRHNRLMVRPHLTTDSETNFNTPDGHVSRKLTLSNRGLGPAFIVSCEIMLDGRPENVTSHTDLETLLRRCTSLFLVPGGIEFGLIRKQHVLAKDQTIVMARFTAVHLGPPHEEELKRISMKVTFRSAYGEQFVYDSNVHDTDQ